MSRLLFGVIAVALVWLALTLPARDYMQRPPGRYIPGQTMGEYILGIRP